MSDSFSFAMGEFEANFPTDYLYAKNHMWALPVSVSGEPDHEHPARIRFGLTAYAVRLLQDVYFLDWTIQPPCSVKLRGGIGSIESKKAESDLYSPVHGQLISINEAVIDDPALINGSPYLDGWLLDFEVAGSDRDVLLTPEQYQEHLVEAWEVAQRTIKGQANQ